MAAEGDLDPVVEGPLAINDINPFARTLAAPTSMLVDLGFAGPAETMLAIEPTAGNMGAGATPVAVKGPTFFFDRVFWTTVEGSKVGVARSLLLFERRVEIGSAEVGGVPVGAVLVGEQWTMASLSVGAQSRAETGSPEPRA
jgi:hypothetical protein